MSRLTSELLGKSSRHRSRWPTLLAEVTNRLVEEYGTPRLGNYRDPFKEIVYILLSARTTEALYQRAHRRLFGRFRNVTELAKAPPRAVSTCVSPAGLGAKRSRQIVRLSRRILRDFGPRPAGKMRNLTAEDAFRYLSGLPGFGPKSAFCVMMYSLDMDVFPVDTHVQRIASRIGVIRRGLKHYEAQKALPKYVPDGLSKELHIALVVHGRRVCIPSNPKCSECVLSNICRTGNRSSRTKRAIVDRNAR